MRGLKLLWVGALLFSVLLLFVGSSPPNVPRSHQEAWDLGHVIAFAYWTLLALRSIPALQRLQWRYRWLLLLLLGGTLGWGIEGLQALIGRHADPSDVLKDVLGVTAALALFDTGPDRLRWRWLLGALPLVAILWSAWPGVRFAMDEQMARRSFPLLANFETRFEGERWIGRSRRQISTEVAWEGQHSLRLDFFPGRFSGATLEYFPRDWRGYEALEFHLFNPTQDTFALHYHIYDVNHQRPSGTYSDRFNGSTELAPGWNEVRILLSQVRSAPKGRELELGAVRGFSLFSTGLTAERSLFLDEVRLTR